MTAHFNGLVRALQSKVVGLILFYGPKHIPSHGQMYHIYKCFVLVNTRIAYVMFTAIK